MILRNVSRSEIHPDWDATIRSRDADIAILVLDETITFTDYIQRVRLPANMTNENMQGIVVGYSQRKETVRAETPRRIIVKAVSRSDCYRDDTPTANLTSDRTFCGGIFRRLFKTDPI